MLHLHHGNRLETLRARLAEITATPLAGALAREHIVVQNPGMARWLTHGLAEAHGIAANHAFTLPASFVWDIFRTQFRDVPEHSAFAPEALAWRIHALLPNCLAEPAFAEPRHYLRDDEDGRKRLQLATRVAGLFDQYLIYRPDLIFAWERGAEPDDWQAALWRRLSAQLGTGHRAGLLRALLERPGGLDAGALPERASLFGITALAPVYLDIFRALAEHIEVHVFLLSPSFQWWGDQQSARDLARRRDTARRLGVAVEHVEAGSDGNPLLASLGGQGREFLKALHERADDDHELYAPPDTLDLLGFLQLDLLFLQDRGGARGQARVRIDAADVSVQVHATHGRIREVQVLHDRLLDLFTRLPDLRARDIVVMAPDIEPYAPLIEAVFGGAPETRRIPWSIADLGVSEAGDEPLVQTFLALLQLPRERFAAGTVLNWLNVSACARRAGLPPAALPRLGRWLHDAGVRWGLNAEHRRDFGIDAEDSHTWAFGLRRLLMGYACLTPEPSDVLIGGIAPHPDVEGQEAVWLGQLAELLTRLERWRAELAIPATPDIWLRRLPRLLDAFFDFDADDEAGEQRIRQALETWREQLALAGRLDAPGTGGAPLEPPGNTPAIDATANVPDARLRTEVVHAHLTRLVADSAGGQRFLGGAVTFCNMVPMRSIPFRVVGLLGMNDADYPRRQPQLGFDRIAAEPRSGDRSRRDDDRTLFLEALLSARDVLYLSYVGNDARDDSARNPSVLVSELLETVARGFDLAGRSLVQRHPLQPFSGDNFRAPHFSHAGEWLPDAHPVTPLVPAPPETRPGVAPEAMTERAIGGAASDDGAGGAPRSDTPITLDLDALHAYFRDPAKDFLTRHLGIRLYADEAQPEDLETFTLDGLNAWRLRNEALERHITDPDAALDVALLRARGELPHGRFGDLATARAEAEAAPIANQVRELLGTASTREFQLDLDTDIRLIGRLAHIGGDGMLRYQAGKLRARDHLATWLDHLVLNALDQAPTRRTRLIGRQGEEIYEPIEDAHVHLSTLIAIFRAGQTRALPLFPESALAWARSWAGKGDAAAALHAAEMEWLGNEYTGAERDQPANAYLFRDRDPLHDDPGFVSLARALFLPLLGARQDKRRRKP